MMLAGDARFPWSTVQLVMRAIKYQSEDYGLPWSAMTQRWSSDEWHYSTSARAVGERLLIQILAARTIEGLFSRYSNCRTEALKNMLTGFPGCKCLGGLGQRWFNEKLECMLWHDQSLESVAKPGLFHVEQCHWCQQTGQCNQCGTECRVSLKRYPEEDSDGFLSVERIIDAGPLDWVLRSDQFSTEKHPAYIGGWTEFVHRQLNVPPALLSCTRMQTSLFREWHPTTLDRLTGFKWDLGGFWHGEAIRDL